MELAQAQSAPTAQPAPSTEFLAMQKLSRQYFPADKVENSSTAITAAIETVNAAGGKVIFNFDAEKGDIPDGYAITISPIKQRNDQGKTDIIGIGIGALPTIEVLQSSPDGQKYITSGINDLIHAKFMNCIRPNKKDEISATIPLTVSDFITSNKAEGVLVAYRKLAPSFIKVLKSKSKGLSGLTDSIFRQILTSTAYATSTFDKVPQQVWQNVLTRMIEEADKQGMQAGMLADWLATRDTAGMPEIEEVNVDDLMDLDF